MCTLFMFFGENYDVMSQKLIKKNDERYFTSFQF